MTGERGRFEIAGLGVEVERSACPGVLAGGAYRPFVSEGRSRPDLRVRCRGDRWPGSRGGELVFDSNGTWSLIDDGDGLVFLPYSPEAPIPCGGEATVSRDWREVEQFGIEEGSPGLAYPLDELAFLHLLTDAGGVLLHASAVVCGGVALVFLGRSGAGKTTISRLWKTTRGVPVLSDDRVAVRFEAGRATAYGTPWHGTGREAAAGCAPVGAVYLLRHSQENRLAPAQRDQAFERFVQASFLPHWDPGRAGRGFEALSILSRDTPVFDLWFTRTPDCVRALWP